MYQGPANPSPNRDNTLWQILPRRRLSHWWCPGCDILSRFRLKQLLFKRNFISVWTLNHHKQCGTVRTRSVLSKTLTIKTHNSPLMSMYGVCCVSARLDYCSVSVTAVLYALSCSIARVLTAPHSIYINAQQNHVQINRLHPFWCSHCPCYLIWRWWWSKNYKAPDIVRIN